MEIYIHPHLHFHAVLMQYKDKFTLLSLRGDFSDAVENGFGTFLRVCRHRMYDRQLRSYLRSFLFPSFIFFFLSGIIYLFLLPFIISISLQFGLFRFISSTCEQTYWQLCRPHHLEVYLYSHLGLFYVNRKCTTD